MSDERINRLEERLAWFERHATEQDKVMLALSRDLERALAELRLLRDRVAASSGGLSEGASAVLPANERPPHY